MERAKDLARRVFPTPGTSSSNACPPLNKATITRRMGFSLPTIVRLRLSVRATILSLIGIIGDN